MFPILFIATVYLHRSSPPSHRPPPLFPSPRFPPPWQAAGGSGFPAIDPAVAARVTTPQAQAGGRARAPTIMTGRVQVRCGCEYQWKRGKVPKFLIVAGLERRVCTRDSHLCFFLLIALN